jgi:Tfp pilus assembly protein PilF
MGSMRKCLLLSLVAMLGVFLLLSPAAAQPKGGALMPEDVYTPLTKGYDFLNQGNYEAARDAFETAVKRDPANPFALNNLAAIQVHQGKYNDAMANLKAATIQADAYLDKVQQTCFVDGLCNAVKPTRGTWGQQAPPGTKSSIAPIIQDNIKKLEAKIAATKTPPPAGSPPPMK